MYQRGWNDIILDNYVNRYTFFIKFLLLFVLSRGTNAGKKRGRRKAKGINAEDGEIEVEIYDGKWVTYCYVGLLKLIMVS